MPIKRNGEPEPAPVAEALGREATESVRRQEHRHLSAAGQLILTGTKHLWLRVIMTCGSGPPWSSAASSSKTADRHRVGIGGKL